MFRANIGRSSDNIWTSAGRTLGDQACALARSFGTTDVRWLFWFMERWLEHLRFVFGTLVGTPLFRDFLLTWQGVGVLP